MRFEKLAEYDIDLITRSYIQKLLEHSFDQYPTTRTYYKQLPHFRYLVWDDDILVAQMGIDNRVIALGKQPTRIFGVVDLCVDDEYRSQGIASTLLQKLETLGQASNIDFIVLFADEHGLYKKNDYQLVNNTYRWLMINDHESLGVTNRTLADTVMVKPLGYKSWNDESIVDFMGHVF